MIYHAFNELNRDKHFCNSIKSYQIFWRLGILGSQTYDNVFLNFLCLILKRVSFCYTSLKTIGNPILPIYIRNYIFILFTFSLKISWLSLSFDRGFNNAWFFSLDRMPWEGKLLVAPEEVLLDSFSAVSFPNFLLNVTCPDFPGFFRSDFPSWNVFEKLTRNSFLLNNLIKRRYIKYN